ENFAPDKRVGYFPAVSAGWMLSNETFMSGVEAVDYLKLKASYGVLGSDRIASRFGYYNRYIRLPIIIRLLLAACCKPDLPPVPLPSRMSRGKLLPNRILFLRAVFSTI